MRRLACLLLIVIATIGGRSPVSGEEWHHAGLVVRHGDGSIVYAYVAFPEETISGIELLRRSGISLVTISFGGLGEGVCTLDGEGCPSSDCRQRVCQGSGDDAPFWKYFRQRTPGEWVALALGGSATKVHDGDLDAWAWTGGEAELPALTLDEVAVLAGVPATPAAGSGSDAAPTPAVRTVYPAGMGPPEPGEGQNLITYLAGVGVVLVVGGAALVVARRRRPERAA